MNRTSLKRRLLAGAAGLAIGTVGTFSFAAPASANDNDNETYGLKPEVEKVQIAGEAECDLEAETWTVKWTVTNASKGQATVSSLTSGGEAVEVEGIELDQVVAGDGGEVSGTQTFSTGTEAAELTAELRWAWQWHGKWFEKKASATADVALGDCKEDTPPDEPPDEEPPALTDRVFFGCDLFVVAIRNDDEPDGVTLELTPNEDVEHGHASPFVDLIDEPEGEFEAPEGFELEGDLEALAAGETFTVGPLNAGEGHAHGFAPSEGLVVTATLLIGDEVVTEAELSWDSLLAEEGIECAEDEDGEGGELPVTGSSTMLIAGGAVLLLAVGGGLFLVARRRRVTFTA